MADNDPDFDLGDETVVATNHGPSNNNMMADVNIQDEGAAMPKAKKKRKKRDKKQEVVVVEDE